MELGGEGEELIMQLGGEGEELIMQLGGGANHATWGRG